MRLPQITFLLVCASFHASWDAALLSLIVIIEVRLTILWASIRRKHRFELTDTTAVSFHSTSGAVTQAPSASGARSMSLSHTGPVYR